MKVKTRGAASPYAGRRRRTPSACSRRPGRFLSALYETSRICRACKSWSSACRCWWPLPATATRSWAPTPYIYPFLIIMMIMPISVPNLKLWIAYNVCFWSKTIIMVMRCDKAGVTLFQLINTYAAAPCSAAPWHSHPN